MGEKIRINGNLVQVRREKGFLYFVEKNGSIYRSKMQHRGRKKGKVAKTLVQKTGLIPDYTRYLYYISSDNYLSRTKRKGVK